MALIRDRTVHPAVERPELGSASAVLRKSAAVVAGNEKKPDVEERRKGSKDDTKPRS